MTFLERVLEPPAYGYMRHEKLYVPSKKELFAELFRRTNIFSSRKNWLAFLGWATTLAFAIPLIVFLTHYFSFKLAFAGFIYSMVCLGSYGTFWFHRYCTHRAFKFQNRFVRFLCRNAVVKVVPEEAYVISHYVHHQISEQPGDPYNVHGGWLYCFLADVNHQQIRQDLNEKDYEQLCRLLNHAGIRLNSYAQYKRWGSLCNPVFTVAHYVLNWAFWYAAFYFIGGTALATALFGFTGVWAVGIRTFNYAGHGSGKDLRSEGSDFNRSDLSVNQIWPGYVAGEWHNNHHLYPNGARSGFLSYQLDIPWLAIAALSKLGAIASFRDYKADFLRDHYRPYQAMRAERLAAKRLALETAR